MIPILYTQVHIDCIETSHIFYIQQFGKITSDMKVYTKQMCIIKFLPVEKKLHQLTFIIHIERPNYECELGCR